MQDLAALFSLVASTRDRDAWPTLEKCQALAALIVALRPKRVVEIGVWRGCSIIPQLLALKHLGAGEAVAIDPWSAQASIAGQIVDGDEENGKKNVAFWQNQHMHDEALAFFKDRLGKLGLESYCRIIRLPSDLVNVDEVGSFEMLHVDGNHAAQAIRDVDRFAPRIPVGGILVMDDLDWSTGHVRRAHDLAKSLGFVDLYPLAPGGVMQRVR